LYRGRGVAGIADDPIIYGYRIANCWHAGTITRLDCDTPITVEIAAGKSRTANAKRGEYQKTSRKPDMEWRPFGRFLRIGSNEVELGAVGHCDFASSCRTLIAVFDAKQSCAKPLT
jgi:hypothetical protein